MLFHIPGTGGAMIPKNLNNYVNAGNPNPAQNQQGPVSSHRVY